MTWLVSFFEIQTEIWKIIIFFFGGYVYFFFFLNYLRNWGELVTWSMYSVFYFILFFSLNLFLLSQPILVSIFATTYPSKCSCQPFRNQQGTLDFLVGFISWNLSYFHFFSFSIIYQKELTDAFFVVVVVFPFSSYIVFFAHLSTTKNVKWKYPYTVMSLLIELVYLHGLFKASSNSYSRVQCCSGINAYT